MLKSASIALTAPRLKKKMLHVAIRPKYESVAEAQNERFEQLARACCPCSRAIRLGTFCCKKYRQKAGKAGDLVHQL